MDIPGDDKSCARPSPGPQSRGKSGLGETGSARLWCGGWGVSGGRGEVGENERQAQRRGREGPPGSLGIPVWSLEVREGWEPAQGWRGRGRGGLRGRRHSPTHPAEQ